MEEQNSSIMDKGLPITTQPNHINTAASYKMNKQHWILLLEVRNVEKNS